MSNKLFYMVLIGICFIFSLSLSAFAAEEKISITTFYPSPYGSYKELSTDTLKVGSSYNSEDVEVAVNDLAVEGNVGIGTTSPIAELDVIGEMKIGNKGLLLDCSAPEAGKMRYNDSTKIMEYCNGSKWLSLGQIEVTTVTALSKQGGGCNWVTTMYCSYGKIRVCPDPNNSFCTDPTITEDNWESKKDLICDLLRGSGPLGGSEYNTCKNYLICTFTSKYLWTAPPRIHHIDQFGVYDEDDGYTTARTEAARCLCPEGQKRIACSGSRQRLCLDYGSEEDLGYIGTLPYTTRKNRIRREGCVSAIDDDKSCNEAVAVCYCAQ